MKTFEDLEFNTHTIGDGLHSLMTFDNDYGISVIKFKGSYGYDKDLWEIAVIYDGNITYNTHIANSVIGYLTDKEVTKIMKQIQKLKK